MSKQAHGKLYLLPVPLVDGNWPSVPTYVTDIIKNLDVFIVERAKTARRFLKEINFDKAFDDCLFFELNKHTHPGDVSSFLEPALSGRNIGLMSEAGLPAIADPGHQVVQLAHRRKVDVCPLVGPSSLMLALMASGMNGQSFAFKGYLSPKRAILGQELKRLEQHSIKNNETQLFIETPYRNEAVLETALSVLKPSTRFCVACDLTAPTQAIYSFSIAQWKKQPKPDLHKRPAVFVLQG